MADPNPTALLQELQDSLKTSKDNSVSVVKNISVLEARVAELTRITGEIEQKVVAYTKAREDFEKQRNEVNDFATAKKTLLEESLPDKDAIADIRTKGEEKVQDFETSLTQSSAKVAQAQTDLKALEKTLETKKAEYASQVDFGVGLTRGLKDLQDLMKSADQENDRNNFAKMYFYVLEMGARLTDVTVPTDAVYRKAFEDTVMGLSQATEDVRKKKDDLELAIADMKKKQGAFDDAKAKRRENTVAAVPAGLGV